VAHAKVNTKSVARSFGQVAGRFAVPHHVAKPPYAPDRRYSIYDTKCTQVRENPLWMLAMRLTRLSRRAEAHNFMVISWSLRGFFMAVSWSPVHFFLRQALALRSRGLASSV
jgi:hypothetical protein